MADADGVLDPTVERLRLCVEHGRKIRAEESGGGGFRLGDDDVVTPKVWYGVRYCESLSLSLFVAPGLLVACVCYLEVMHDVWRSDQSVCLHMRL